ncbi:MAG: aspartate kinase [Syntrophomonadaceae bacterium]|nr:aspartate kinase [Syntrophomonadaceae bacterium]
MRIIVQKFGGTSVSTEEKRRRVAQKVIEAKTNGFTPVVVVSAMGRLGDPYATDTLLRLAGECGPLSKRDTDLLLSCGEIIACSLVAATLLQMQQPAVVLTGREVGIFTDSNFGDARITRVDPRRIWSHLRENKIVIVAGFQGVTEEGEVTTLGRGGSDTTACALGVALNAEVIDIFTDVEGIMTADPRIVDSARLLDQVTYNEICQLAYQGAKVIHPRAVEIAMQRSIPVRVRSTFSNGPGTLVSHLSVSSEMETDFRYDRLITGVTQMANVSQIKINIAEGPDPARSPARIFRALADVGISVDLINVHPETVVFTVNADDGRKAVEVLEQEGFLVSMLPGCAKVSVVGGGMAGMPGVMAAVCEALCSEGISILQSADSHTTIWCLVKNEDMARAVRALHDKFALDK